MTKAMIKSMAPIDNRSLHDEPSPGNAVSGKSGAAPVARADVLQGLIEAIRIDSQSGPKAFLDESIAPFGGE